MNLASLTHKTQLSDKEDESSNRDSRCGNYDIIRLYKVSIGVDNRKDEVSTMGIISGLDVRSEDHLYNTTKSQMKDEAQIKPAVLEADQENVTTLE